MKTLTFAEFSRPVPIQEKVYLDTFVAIEYISIECKLHEEKDFCSQLYSVAVNVLILFT